MPEMLYLELQLFEKEIREREKIIKEVFTLYNSPRDNLDNHLSLGPRKRYEFIDRARPIDEVLRQMGIDGHRRGSFF